MVGEAASVNAPSSDSALRVMCITLTAAPRARRQPVHCLCPPLVAIAVRRSIRTETPPRSGSPIPAAMPATRSVAVRTDVTRTTGRATTSRTAMPFRTSSVPVWLIKLVSVIIAIVVLILIALLGDIRTHYPKVYLVTALTCGVLLGWSVGSVLQQVLTIRNVEIIINITLTVLSVTCLVCAAFILVDKSDYSRYDWYSKEIGILICFIIQSIFCLLMFSWACYGTIIVVETR